MTYHCRLLGGHIAREAPPESRGAPTRSAPGAVSRVRRRAIPDLDSLCECFLEDLRSTFFEVLILVRPVVSIFLRRLNCRALTFTNCAKVPYVEPLDRSTTNNCRRVQDQLRVPNNLAKSLRHDRTSPLIPPSPTPKAGVAPKRLWLDFEGVSKTYELLIRRSQVGREHRP